ncbi:hypothetical protein NDU88_001611 [Pleurodeles waltl]|uniref:Uncharacterized protein n=1 Tax=Pleurodeles waltl TaxID=8319 RepID=A0AAV7SZP4_PLEWA|nr:hypothetical protein NDU88_001611 [Pleurodeles waltl]
MSLLQETIPSLRTAWRYGMCPGHVVFFRHESAVEGSADGLESSPPFFCATCRRHHPSAVTNGPAAQLRPASVAFILPWV